MEVERIEAEGAAEVDAGEEEDDVDDEEEAGVDPGEEDASAATVVTLIFMPWSQWPIVPQAK